MSPDSIFAYKETCGIRHEPQLLEIELPPGADPLLTLRDRATGRIYVAQRSKRHPERGFLNLEIAPYENLDLVWDTIAAMRTDLRIDGGSVLTNGLVSLRVLIGEERTGDSGPILAHRVGAHPWRGRSFFDTRRPIVRREGKIVEEGPLRIVYHFRAETEGDGFYEADITLDAGQNRVRIDERFHLQAGDQLVWDYAGPDLPDELRVLDSSAGYTVRPLHFHIDQRHARLAAWTQYSQMPELCDGYALTFGKGGDAIGAVTLEGGSWRGKKLNHIEAWCRRWIGADAGSRRLVPPEAKADTFPGPEQIPARGPSIGTPHFSLEAWIGEGTRSWALVLCERDQLGSAANSGADEAKGCSPALGHFEDVPDRARYAEQQSLLRRIHIQHGMFPLRLQQWIFANAPLEPARPPRELGPLFDHHFSTTTPDLARLETPAALAIMRDFLAARVYGFWEGSGAAYSNCVVSRRIAPYMLYFERLVALGQIGEEDQRQFHAWFLFLAGLFHSDNYYPGSDTMAPMDSPETVEPTLAGMANQNFYTDVLNVPGTAAQVFPSHPHRRAWQNTFSAFWQQLDYHVYPKSGLWEESHTYYLHVLVTVHDALRRRREDGVENAFADPRLQKMVEAALHQLTPRDRYFDHRRYVAAIGDHFAETKRGDHLAAYAADFLADAPQLAAHLAWGAQEMGATPPASVTPAPFPLRSEYFQGLGVFFRGHGAVCGETMLAFRSGTAWAHHHDDEGALQFYAFGQALVVDAAFSHAPVGAGQRKVHATGHSRAAAPEFPPLNHRWRFNRGWITAHRCEGPLAYAVAWIPTYQTMGAQEQIITLRQPRREFRFVVQLAADLYLVSDVRLGATSPATTRLHVPETALEISPGRVRAIYGEACLDVATWGGASFEPARADHYLAGGKPEGYTRELAMTPTETWSGFVLSASLAKEAPPEIEAQGETVRISARNRSWTLVRRSTHEYLIDGDGALQIITLSEV